MSGFFARQTPVPDRRTLLRAWTARQARAQGGVRAFVPLPVEASARRFYRVTFEGGATAVAIDAPPGREDSERYLRLARVWRCHGLRVPEVYAADPGRGLLLVEDFGAQTLDDVLNETNADAIYQRALAELGKVQALPADPELYPAYADRIAGEFEIFEDWLVRGLAGLDPRPLAPFKQLLIDSALAQPTVVIHLDWHSRNLMYAEQGDFGIVDFQDAHLGPYTYDVVSLLRDCYRRFEPDRVARWIDWYGQQRENAHLVDKDYHRQLDWMGVQRHLKAAGIFVRMQRRDGNPRHLEHVVPTLASIVHVAGRYPELAGLADWVSARVLPASEDRLPCG